jgi:hypothetical protein
MSGHKRATISITEEEYQRLLDVEVQLRAQTTPTSFFSQPPDDLIERTQTAINQNLQWMQARQAHFDQVVSGYQSEIQRIETAANHALAAQQNHLMHQMQEVAGELWAHTGSLLQQSRQQYQQQLVAVQNRLYQEIAVVNQQLADRDKQDQNSLAVADYWLEAANNLYRLLDSQYDHNFLRPGELDRLAGQIQMAAQNLSYGLAEASIASAQQVYLRLSNAHVRLRQVETEWILLEQACIEAVHLIYAEIDASQEITAIDIDGSPIPFQLDVDFWTKGEWSVLANEFLQTIQSLRMTNPRPSAELMEEMLTEYLPSVRTRLADICFSARIEALNSQLRVNIADLVVQALTVQGFALAEFHYNQDDFRAPFEAHLTSPDQSQVTVQVIPNGANLGANELHIISDDQMFRTQRELRQRWAEVQSSLVSSGLMVADIETVEAPRQLRSHSSRQNQAYRLNHP